METGPRDKHSSLPPLTWEQQMLVSDRIPNPQKKMVIPLALHFQIRTDGKATLEKEMVMKPFVQVS